MTGATCWRQVVAQLNAPKPTTDHGYETSSAEKAKGQ